MIKFAKQCAAVALGLALGGCMAPKNSPDYAIDPYEPMNRFFFEVNREFNYVLRPMSKAYEAVVPKPLRLGVHNFFANTYMVPTMVNDLLQANTHYFWHDLARFLINSTIGLAGIFDIASKVGLYAHPQGFGYTLTKWGLTPSPYVVLPIFGPSTMTSSVGLVTDYFMDPVTYYDYHPWWTYYPVRAVQILDIASRELPKEEILTQTALDPYIAVRNAYLQNRKHNMLYITYDGSPPEEEFNRGLSDNIHNEGPEVSPAISPGAGDMSPAMMSQDADFDIEPSDGLDAPEQVAPASDGEVSPAMQQAAIRPYQLA